MFDIQETLRTHETFSILDNFPSKFLPYLLASKNILKNQVNYQASFGIKILDFSYYRMENATECL